MSVFKFPIGEIGPKQHEDKFHRETFHFQYVCLHVKSLKSLFLLVFSYLTLPPTIMEVENMGPSNISFLSFRAMFHFHDYYGRKGRCYMLVLKMVGRWFNYLFLSKVVNLEKVFHIGPISSWFESDISAR